MRFLSILYALGCLGVVALFTAGAITGYSPFAEGGARPFFVSAPGPNHK